MPRWGRLLAGVALLVAAVVALGFGTRWVYTATPADEAALRLAWRANVPLVEECRELSAEEQAELPVHMRRERVCEGRVASYRLEAAVDGRVLHQATISGAGARGDRPLYVFETLPVEPGRHRLRVSFVRVGAEAQAEVGSDAGAARSPDVDPDREPDADDGNRSGRGRAVPDRLVLEREVEVEPREVLLVTYVAGGGRLVLR
jgi:hypothetical protein